MAESPAMNVDEANEETHQDAIMGDDAGHVEAQVPTELSSGLFQEQTEIISQIEIDSGRSDNDSSLGDEVSSMSTSMRTVDYEFTFEHGRRYQSANDKYHLPNDIQEIDRLELQHLIWIELCGGRYHLAPLQDVKMTHVLDVGTGTGNWAIEFANLHPDVQVLGTDLSPIQPEYVPVNCTFYIDDAMQDWAFHQLFDYIHIRALTMGINDWEKIIDQAYKYLQPGGYIELQEFHIPLESPDDSIKEGSALWHWGEKVHRLCGRLGIDAMAAPHHANRLRRRGFQDVDQKPLHCPLGPWAKGQRQKRLGWMGRKDLYEGIEGMSKRLFMKMGEYETEADVDTFLEECREELMDPKIHPCMPLDVCWGQRPLGT